jgi:maltose-binding protein MalE
VKEIILNHLSNNYKVSLNSYTTFKLLDKSTNEDKSLRTVMNDTIELMGVTDKEFEGTWEVWINEEIIRFENYIVDLQYKIYQKTGIELNLHENKFKDVVKTLPYSDKLSELDGGLLSQISEINATNYN